MINEENKGCGFKGLDLNSGWNCTPMNHGWFFNSTISGNLLSGEIPENISQIKKGDKYNLYLYEDLFY